MLIKKFLTNVIISGIVLSSNVGSLVFLQSCCCFNDPTGVCPATEPTGVCPQATDPTGVCPQETDPTGVCPQTEPTGVCPVADPTGVCPATDPTGVCPAETTIAVEQRSVTSKTKLIVNFIFFFSPRFKFDTFKYRVYNSKVNFNQVK